MNAMHAHKMLVGTLGAIVAAALGASAASAFAAEDPEELPRTVPVARTYNDSPFSYRIESRSRKSGVVVLRLTYPSPVVTPVEQNNTIPAEYYLPGEVKPGQPKRPAVICLHILHGNYELERMTCSMLAAHGIPAILFKLPYYGERALGGGHKALADDPRRFAEALAQGVEDVRRTVDLLASRPEVDPDRIGVVGISMGGILAASAAGTEPRLARAMLILAGGDLLAIIRHADETRELSALLERLEPRDRALVTEALQAIDPLRHAASLRGRAREKRVLMVNASDDRVIPRACTEKLAAALGISDQVVWLEGLGHYTAMAAFPRILQRCVDFFGEDLPAQLKTTPTPSPAASQSPTGIVVALLRQVEAFATSEPQPGRCHLADLEVSVTPRKDQPVEGRLQVIRGRDNRFRIEVKVPGRLEAAIGQGRYPWIASGAKAVFLGSKAAPAQPADPLQFADERHLLKLRVAGGALAGVLLVPDMLEQIVAIHDEAKPGGPRTLRISAQGKDRGTVRLALREDGRSVERIAFDIDEVRGTIRVGNWQINTIAPDALFDPPPGVPRQQVEATELHRIFSAMFNFAMESAE